MSMRNKTLTRENYTRAYIFQTLNPLTSIRLGRHMSKSVSYPVLLSIHVSRFDMLTPVCREWALPGRLLLALYRRRARLEHAFIHLGSLLHPCLTIHLSPPL
jgi:hypothetical protein